MKREKMAYRLKRSWTARRAMRTRSAWEDGARDGRKFGVDEERLRWPGCCMTAQCMPLSQMRRRRKRKARPGDEGIKARYMRSPGAHVAQDVYDVYDQEVLGRDPLAYDRREHDEAGKIVYLADMIERTESPIRGWRRSESSA